ncbi:MAG: hypothetical protein PHO15_07385, partial [Eubacteriales bacterium]|nr:hypothetical protein [Eubacteriales bacterium]
MQSNDPDEFYNEMRKTLKSFEENINKQITVLSEKTMKEIMKTQSNNKKDIDSYQNEIKKQLDTVYKHMSREFKTMTKEYRMLSDNNNKRIQQVYCDLLLQIKQALSATKDIQGQVLNVSRMTGEAIQKLNGKIESYSSIIEAQNGELNKFREGYNFSINKDIILRTIRLIEEIDDMQNDGIGHDSVVYIRKQLSYSLQNEGIYDFSPKINDDFNSLDCQCINTVETQRPELNGKVAAIVKPGYKIEVFENEDRIVIPCGVIVYKYESTIDDNKAADGD